MNGLRQGVGMVALVLAGCDPADPTVAGELNRGRFEYVCVAETDLSCRDFDIATRFPEAFAVGGRFSIRFEPSDGGPLPRVEPAAPGVLALQSSILTFERAGTSAILALRGSELVDYRHLEAFPVTAVEFRNEAAATIVDAELIDREERAFSAIPLDAFDRPLSGALSYQWRVEDESIASLVTSSTSREVTIRGHGVGTTVLEVDVGGMIATLPLVVETPPPHRDSGDSQ
jgi:hypothetical protein